MSTATTTEATAVPTGQAGSAPRAHLVAGAASALVSGLLGLTWLWVSLALLITAVAAAPAAGAGVLLLIPWVLAMRLAASLERRRARAVHGIDVRVPARRVSERPGFPGWLHGLWLDLTSWPFWRAVLHHHIVMLVGLLISSIFWAGLLGAGLLVDAAVRGVGDLSLLGVPLDALRLVLLALALLAVGIGVLVAGALAERGLGRAFLPDLDDALREEVEEMSSRRQGAVDAAEAERLRIERDLHDGVQPRLVALAMTLGLARSRIRSDPGRAEELVAEAHQEAKGIMTELRQLARGIHPAVLTDRGLDAALSALAARSAVPVSLHVDLPVRAGREQEAVAYFVVSEALTNIAKHAGAASARVDLRGDAHQLRLLVEDDGVGGAAVRRDGVSTGLAGLTDRVRATGGRLDVASEPGHGTRLVARIPLDERRAQTASRTENSR